MAKQNPTYVFHKGRSFLVVPDRGGYLVTRVLGWAEANMLNNGEGEVQVDPVRVIQFADNCDCNDETPLPVSRPRAL